MSAKEQKQLLAFAESGRQPCRKEVLALLRFIVERVNSVRPMDEQSARQSISPDVAPDAKQLRYLLTDGLVVVREYLTQVQLKAERHTAQRLLLNALRSRQMDALVAKEHAESVATASRHDTKDSEWHLHQYHLQKIAYDLPEAANRSKLPDYQPAQEQLTAYFCSEYLRTTAMALAQEAFAKAAQKLPYLEQVLVMGAVLKDLSATVHIYYTLVQIFIQPEEQGAFQNWKEAFAQNGSKLSRTEQREVFLIGLNFCIKQMNSGNRGYIKEAFDLYKQALASDILHENGLITAFTYKNIIRIGAALGEHDWVTDFYETQKMTLHPREREEAYAYNGAFLHFQRKEYHLAMPLLQRTNLSDRLNNLDARRMLLRTYFELNEFQALESLLDSFATYLRRQKDLGYHREMYLNLVYYTRKIMEKSTMKAAQRNQLLTEIKALDFVADRDWLMGMLNG